MYAAAFFYKSGEANIINCFCTHPTSFELYRSCAKYVSRILMSLRDVKVEKWSSFCSTCSVMAEKSSPATPCVRSCCAGPSISFLARKRANSPTDHDSNVAALSSGSVRSASCPSAAKAGRVKRKTKQLSSEESQWSVSNMSKLVADKSIVTMTPLRHKAYG